MYRVEKGVGGHENGRGGLRVEQKRGERMSVLFQFIKFKQN